LQNTGQVTREARRITEGARKQPVELSDPDYRTCNTFCGTNRDVPRTVQARLDERSEQDLAVLRNEGHSDSEAIRLALREAAEQRRRKSALRLEAEAAGADPDDLAEARRVRAEMDAIAAVWNDVE
jgi:Arc/MetJ-type ribon-helix-helix transcriptional regulator